MHFLVSTRKEESKNNKERTKERRSTYRNGVDCVCPAERNLEQLEHPARHDDEDDDVSHHLDGVQTEETLLLW